MIQFSPVEDDGEHCTAGETYTLDVCNVRDEGGDPYELPSGAGSALGLDSDTGNCIDGEEIVAMWLSTGVTGGGDSSNLFIPPVTGSNETGGALGSAFVVSGESAAAFVIGGDDLVDGSGEHEESYEHAQPDFSFTQI
ncbi:MAG: hypothetical protein O3A01_04690 [bacterium]|nr:hypothetical protein [bacterium]